MRLRHFPALAFSALGAFGALCIVPPAALTAQRLTGTVLLPGGTAPAAGVVIAAADSAGRDIAHSVSLDDGSFSFFVDSTQPLTFSAHRVGFRPTPVLAAARRFRDGETETARVTLAAERLPFPAKAPRRATTCSGGSAEGRAAVAALLGEARTVLRAARFRVGRPDIETRYTTFQHRTAKNGEDTLYTFMRRADGTAPVLFDETPAEELERRGFFATIMGEREFAPLGLETLLSDWFPETHCFTLGRISADQVSMRFEPTRERKGLVDVEGEYVFDRATLGLRRVSYAYVNLPAEERKSGAGGLVEFAQAPNGNWVSLHWMQRFPLLGYRQSSGNTSFVQSQMTLIDIIGHRVIGGRTNAVLAGRRPVFRHDPVPTGRTATPFQAACPERLVTAATSAATGRLVANDSLGVDRVLVRATWKVLVVVDRTEMAEREHVRETATGPGGEWTMCDLPVDRDIELSWSLRGKEEKRPLKFSQAGLMVNVPEA
jgi:hypothetical protein